MAKIRVQETEVTVVQIVDTDYISLSDMARQRDSTRTDYIIQNWLRTRFALEFLGLWERINNPYFNSIEFDGIKIKSGLNSFVITPKQWVERTNAIVLGYEDWAYFTRLFTKASKLSPTQFRQKYLK